MLSQFQNSMCEEHEAEHKRFYNPTGVNDNAGMQFWTDSIMIAEGDQPHDYAD